MTTRSGKEYKSKMADGESGEAAASISLTEMLKMLVEDRQRMERERAEERAAERRRHEEQMEVMRQLVEETRREALEARGSGAGTVPKLAKLTESDDVEAYLTTFERTMTAYRVEQNRWSYMLAPQLTGKAQKAFSAMAVDQAGDYNALKEAILLRYDITEEAYRQRFRAVKKGDETNRELATRTMDLLQKWTKECTSKQEVLEFVAVEQLLNVMPEDIRVWVRERKPKTAAEAGELADDYLQARKREMKAEPIRTTDKSPEAAERKRCYTCGSVKHLAWECPQGSRSGGAAPGRERHQKQEGEVKCFNCGRRGHISTRCPRDAMFCEVGPGQGRLDGGDQPQQKGVSGKSGRARSGLVEGRRVDDILLDTGCSKTLVRRDLIPEKKVLEGDVVTIRCAHGDTVVYPVVEVEMDVDGVKIQVEAAVSDTLPRSVLLGTDVPEFSDLLGSGALRDGKQQVDDVMAVVTRAQAKRQEAEEVVRCQREEVSGVKTNPVEEDSAEIGLRRADGSSGEQNQEAGDDFTWGSEFAEDIFVSGRERKRQTRQQKRDGRWQFAQGPRSDVEGESTHALDISAEELSKMQDADATLATVRRVAGEETDTATGHIGKDKTAQRVLQRFYWPTVYKDVADYCRSCGDWQKAGNRSRQRASLPNGLKHQGVWCRRRGGECDRLVSRFIIVLLVMYLWLLDCIFVAWGVA